MSDEPWTIEPHDGADKWFRIMGPGELTLHVDYDDVFHEAVDAAALVVVGSIPTPRRSRRLNVRPRKPMPDRVSQSVGPGRLPIPNVDWRIEMKWELAALVCAILLSTVAAASRSRQGGLDRIQASIGLTFLAATLAFLITVRADDPKALESAGLGHLRDDAPCQQCSVCGRKTWTRAEFGRPCEMPQPNGRRCPGVFR